MQIRANPLKKIGNPDRLVDAYIDGLSLTSIYILSSRESGTCRACSSADLHAAMEAAKTESLDLVLIGRCKTSHAELLLAEIEGDRFELRKTGGPQDLACCILSVAERLGVDIQSEQSMRSAALPAVAHIESQFDQLLHSGQLRKLNRRYRDYRLALPEGARPIPYARWLHNEKTKAVRAAATVSSSTSFLGAPSS